MWRAALPKTLQSISLSVVLTSCGVLIGATAIISYFRFTTTHLPPNIFVNDIAIGKRTYEDAEKLLYENSPLPPDKVVTVTVDDISVSSQSAELGIQYNYDHLLEQLKRQATSGRLRDRVTWRLTPLFSPQYYVVALDYDDDKVQQLLEQLNQQIAYTGQDPYASLKISNNPNSLTIFEGKQGREIHLTATRAKLRQSLALPQSSATISATVASTAAQLSDQEVLEAASRSALFIGKSIKMTFENSVYSIDDREMISYLVLPKGFDEEAIKTKVATLSAAINREPQEPELEYDKKSLAVTKFSPPMDGISLDTTTTVQDILKTLETLETQTSTDNTDKNTIEYQLVVKREPPKTTLADTNDLGIKEEIGLGDSHYDHSIPNRIHNVAITTERISNIIVPPGSEFSFNKAVGDVSAATGYRSAYVIKNGQTALGDGGGVCQVSTTLFRAVLDAGLKVTRRLPHSYRVSYYELDSKPGVDATVYSGNTDFRFVNDTDHHILIHSEADSSNLYMYVAIYGTSDGRTSEIVEHKTWNARPAPPPEYFPDPSLPAGKLVQFDWAAPGISASFVNVIKDAKGNILREDKYTSNYQPWSAKYRQGTGT